MLKIDKELNYVNANDEVTPFLPAGIENQYTKNSALFFVKKKYTKTEKAVHCCLTVSPGCGLCDSLRKEVKNGNFVDPNPIIAYRADTREPKEIFSEGFSAYHPSRLSFVFPDLSAEDTCGKVTKPICIFTFCLPFLALINAFEAMLYCCRGSLLYEAPFVSSWPALAMTLNFDDANVWRSSKETYYRYIMLVDGVISFSEFSNALIRENSYLDPRSGDNAIYDAQEVFPKDPDDQTVAPEQIIGAAGYGIDYTIMITFNPKFIGFSLIKNIIDENFSTKLNDECQLILSNKKELIELLNNIKNKIIDCVAQQAPSSISMRR